MFKYIYIHHINEIYIKNKIVFTIVKFKWQIIQGILNTALGILSAFWKIHLRL